MNSDPALIVAPAEETLGTLRNKAIEFEEKGTLGMIKVVLPKDPTISDLVAMKLNFEQLIRENGDKGLVFIGMFDLGNLRNISIEVHQRIIDLYSIINPSQYPIRNHVILNIERNNCLDKETLETALDLIAIMFNLNNEPIFAANEEEMPANLQNMEH